MTPKDLVAELLKRNPEIMNNPQARSYIEAIQSGDQERIKSIGMNICDTYGVTPEQARNDTMRFFGFH